MLGIGVQEMCPLQNFMKLGHNKRAAMEAPDKDKLLVRCKEASSTASTSTCSMSWPLFLS